MDFMRASGVLVHPTSFPSNYGIGDLGKGAYDFIDFLKMGNQTLWQVLPLNPTSFGDSPYQSFSTFAGNPLLISPDILMEDGYLNDDDIKDFPVFDKRKIDYGVVIENKYKLLRRSYNHFKKAKKNVLNEFEDFCNKEAHWLDSYCLFVAIKYYFIQERENTFETSEYKKYSNDNKTYLSKNQIDDYFYGAVWNSWPADIASYQKEAVEEWSNKLEDEVSYYKYLQFMFFKQWFALKEYANNYGVNVIGDIPIFIAMDSADLWANKSLFQLDKNAYPKAVAGVPPDYFSETGQLWGNPLYDWDKHAATGYEWWIKRISHTLKMVDIVRIDHFRGFESYWSIPYGEKTAMNGKWVKGPGEELFVKLEKELGSLPIIAEDLGIITEEVTALREKLGLPGMKVLQFGFDARSNNLNMAHNFTSDNIIVYSGTHDNNTTIGWYKSITPKIQDQFRRISNVSGENSAWDMIRLAFLSIGRYSIIPIQDVIQLDEEDRMNTPGTPSGNWQFRYTADMLTDSVAEGLKYLSKLSDRNAIEDETDESSEETLIDDKKTINVLTETLKKI